MARVKVLINNVERKVLSTQVVREGERAIDQSNITFPVCAAVCISDEILIIQDAIDLNNLVGAYMMQGCVKDESGLANDSFGSITRPPVDVRLLWCNSNSVPANFGIRELCVTDNGSSTCAPGKAFNKAICFCGTCDYSTLNCESIFDIDQTTQLTLSAWVKTSSTSVPIISKKATVSTDKGWEMSIDACGRIEFRITNTSGTNELHIRGDTAINTCTFQHVAITYSGVPGDGACAIEIYVNGVVDTKGVITNNLTGCTLNCSDVTYASYADGSPKFTGAMDDACIWISRRLTVEEIRSVYNVGIIQEVSGRTGRAIRFNGTDSFAEIPYSTDFDFTGNFDITVWARWQNCGTQYIYARRKLSGNGWALSVNRLCTGDIVAEIDGTLIKTTGTCYNDFEWHFIRVYRGTDNVVHLEVDDIEKNCSTIASNLTLASPAMFIGTNHNKTAYFCGDINTIRVYGRQLSCVQATRLFSCVTAVSLMKFGGTITKIQKEILKKEVIAQSFGSSLGFTEVKAQAYNDRSPEFIIEDLIRDNTELTPHIHGTGSGITLNIFNADGKLIDIIRDLTQLVGQTFNTDALKRFHLHDTAFNTTCFVFTHGLNSRNFECVEDNTEIINDLVVVGEKKKFCTIECFTGTGSQTEFTLTAGAISARVLIGGSEQEPEEDYNFCILNKTVTFVCAPACAASISVEFQYEIPLLIRGIKQSSIDLNGRYSKRLIMPWIRTRNDGIRFINGYLNKFKEIRTSLKIELPTMRNSLNEGDVVRVVNSIKNIDDSFVVKSLTWLYPEMKTIVLLGEFKFDDLEYEKQIIEKLHDLESALTEIKSITCSEQIEEVLSLTDTFNIIQGTLCGTVFVETGFITDAIKITIVIPAVYGVGVYGVNIYGSPAPPGGFTSSGYTCSGYDTT